MIFVLDNYDSFTYNLVQYLGELGAEVEVRRNDQVTVEEVEALHPERILLSPGPCTPQEAGISIELIRHFAGKLPVLGVCLGHQAIGAAFGGQVVRAGKLMHGKTSQVEHDGKTIFRGLASPMTATRYHSLIVAEDTLPEDLEISARTRERDGASVIMGLRHRRYPVEGVQFHPESVLTTEGKQLIRNFLALEPPARRAQSVERPLPKGDPARPWCTASQAMTCLTVQPTQAHASTTFWEAPWPSASRTSALLAVFRCGCPSR
jgi:anthranilate synthase/aminodeoxychorismate synthase-like glutamine amidotransferase